MKTLLGILVVVVAIATAADAGLSGQSNKVQPPTKCLAWRNDGSFNPMCLASSEQGANDNLKRLWKKVIADTKKADAHVTNTWELNYPKLIAEQQAWLKFADVACTEYAGDSELARANGSDCRVDVINARIKQLSDYDDWVQEN